MREYNFCEKPNCPCGGDPDKPKRDDGGPAFPMPSGAEPRVNETTHYNEGMTLRDYFAGQALAVLLANPGARWKRFPDEPAQDAYAVADAMLAAREGGAK